MHRPFIRASREAIPSFPSVRRFVPVATAACLVLALAACRDDKPAGPAPAAAPETAPAAAVPPPAPVDLKDVIQTDPRYIVGITFPPKATRYPGLAAELRGYADRARDELMKALAEVPADQQRNPYDLSLNFNELADTPLVYAVAAEGVRYTGGAHGEPLVARFVWLPGQQRMLTADGLLADPRGWGAVSDYAREQLHAALSQRIDADELPATERAELMKTSGEMIDAGTTPTPASFAAFEPLLSADGAHIVGLRFVFPPYQVGPYVDGVRTVDVPASVLMPYLAPEARGLFAIEAPRPAAPTAGAPTATPASVPTKP